MEQRSIQDLLAESRALIQEARAETDPTAKATLLAESEIIRDTVRQREEWARQELEDEDPPPGIGITVCSKCHQRPRSCSCEVAS